MIVIGKMELRNRTPRERDDKIESEGEQGSTAQTNWLLSC